MAEYSALDGSISGKPKGQNFFMGDKALKRDKNVKIELDGMMNKDIGNDLVIEREKREIKEYNDNLVKSAKDTEAKNYLFTGNSIVVRLFKHNPHVDSVFIKEKRPITVRHIDQQSGKAKTEEAFLQNINRGVIVNKTGKYSDFFNENFNVGDVVDLKFGLSIEQQMCFLEPQKFYLEGIACFDNYFILNENMIEKKVLNYEC